MWYGVPELWFDISNHTTFCVTPSFLTIAHQHLAQHRLFHFAIPYFKSHHISHIMYRTTSRIRHPISHHY